MVVQDLVPWIGGQRQNQYSLAWVVMSMVHCLIVCNQKEARGSARFAANPILDFRNQKSGQSVKLFWILVSRHQQTAYSCLEIQTVETENE